MMYYNRFSAHNVRANGRETCQRAAGCAPKLVDTVSYYAAIASY